ncbi:zinc finger protein 629-like [Armigeres subalbatus]|uniref:zinc finger protein 629-like n=1 Tax=Armigeres subalbatus TaxID=124917 RepID=UPI002ED12C11
MIMTSPSVKTETIESEILRHVCRLCLSENDLADVFKEDDLHQWIMDFLAITISSDGRLSQAICNSCRTQLTEFHQFRLRSQEVERALQSSIRNDNVGTETSEIQETFESMTNKLKQDGSHEESAEIPDEPSNQIVESEEREETKTAVEHNAYEIDDQEDDNSLDLKLYDAPYPIRLNYEENGGASCFQHEPQHECTINSTAHVDSNNAKKDVEQNDTTELIELHDATDNKALDDATANVEQNDATGNNPAVETSPKCHECHKMFDSTEKMLRHHKVVHGPRNIVCRICDVAFTRRQELERHQRSKKHKAQLEKEKLQGRKRLKNDNTSQARVFEKAEVMVIEDDASVAANVSTNSGSNFDTEHQAQVDQQLECDICHKLLFGAKKLNAHKKRHDIKGEMCPICQKNFLNRFVLNRHMKLHEPIQQQTAAEPAKYFLAVTGEYKCPTCPLVYTSELTLKHHQKRAHGPKVHKCNFCDQLFSIRSELTGHMKRKHHNIENVAEYA